MASSLEIESSLHSTPSTQNSPDSSELPAPSASQTKDAPLEAATKNKSGTFKAKMVLATWSQASSTMDRTSILEHLKTMSTGANPIIRAVVAQETHADGGIHFHAVVEWEQGRTMRPTAFKLMGQTADVKTHRKGRGSYADSLSRAWKYCVKEDKTPLIIGEAPKEREKVSKRTRDFLEAIRLSTTLGVEPALKYLRKEQPYDAVTRLDSVRRGLEAARRAAVCTTSLARSLEDFTYKPFLPEDWRTLYIYGPSGCGKTALARALLPDASVIRHRNQLVGADPSKGLIFDDFDVSHWPATAVIHLVDWEEVSGIDVKHSHVEIPPQTRKIFTMNVDPDRWIPQTASQEQVEAVKRRMHAIHVMNKLF